MLDGGSQFEIFPTDLHLRRINTSQNMNRFYHMTVQRDLFVGASLIRVWGRIGTAGRQRIDTFVDEGRAVSALMALSQKKRRRGYSLP
jgi:predicted DNA-binding WGR domain protein